MEQDLPRLSPATFALWTSQGKWRRAKHLDYLDREIIAAIHDAAAGLLDGLIVTMPPQHGKSHLCSCYTPAWYLGTDGYQVQVVLEQEPGSAGKSVTEYLGRKLAGHSFAFDRPTGAKEVRAQPFAGQCGINNVCLVQAEWNAAYIEELCGFPNFRHDDQVDGSSGAFMRLSRYSQGDGVPASFRSAPSPRLLGYSLDLADGRSFRWQHRGARS